MHVHIAQEIVPRVISDWEYIRHDENSIIILIRFYFAGIDCRFVGCVMLGIVGSDSCVEALFDDW